MKIKILKDRSGIGIVDYTGYYPDRITNIGDVYRMSYIEIIERAELMDNEEFLLGLINKKIYVSNDYVTYINDFIPNPSTIRGTIMNVFIKENFKEFYEKYKLLFDN